MSVRTVREMLSRLQAAGHLEIEGGHGPGNSNRYTLTRKYGQPTTAFNSDNSGSPLPVCDQQMRQSDVSIAAVERINSGSRLPPNYSISNSIINAPAPGPRRAEDALGPLGAALRNRIGPAPFEDWFVKGKVELVEQTADTVTVSVRSKFFAEQIRNRFETDIVACSGGTQRIEFVVRGA
jgi:hypothetical protein